MKLNFSGLIAPVFATFNDDKSLNLDIIKLYASFLNKKDIRGVLVNGTSGEGMSMNVKERKLIAEAWSSSKKLDHIMIQVGGAALPDVIELARHAESIGANSILCLPELYSKPQNAQELIKYLKIVGKAAPNTPLLYYHIPMFTNVNIHMGNLLNEIDEEVPTFCGIKFTSNCLDEGVEALKANNGKFTIFLGADTLMLGAYALGFNSAIATTLNIFPEIGLTILQNYTDNRKARIEQEKLTKITSAITKYGKWVPTMKAAMNLFSPINCGPVREPLDNLTKEQINQMKLDLNEII